MRLVGADPAAAAAPPAAGAALPRRLWPARAAASPAIDLLAAAAAREWAARSPTAVTALRCVASAPREGFPLRPRPTVATAREPSSPVRFARTSGPAVRLGAEHPGRRPPPRRCFAKVLRRRTGSPAAADASDLLIARTDLGRVFPEPAAEYVKGARRRDQARRAGAPHGARAGRIPSQRRGAFHRRGDRLRPAACGAVAGAAARTRRCAGRASAHSATSPS